MQAPVILLTPSQTPFSSPLVPAQNFPRSHDHLVLQDHSKIFKKLETKYKRCCNLIIGISTPPNTKILARSPKISKHQSVHAYYMDLEVVLSRRRKSGHQFSGGKSPQLRCFEQKLSHDIYNIISRGIDRLCENFIPFFCLLSIVEIKIFDKFES